MVLHIRNLRLVDFTQAQFFEDIFGYDLSSLKDDEDNDYSFGFFLDEQLIGVATVGGADVVSDEFYLDYLLSDVGIHPDYQGQGYGYQFIEGLLKDYEDRNVFADIMDNSLFGFYKKLGFVFVDKKQGLIVKHPVK